MSTKQRYIIGILILLLAIGFIAYGAWRGEVDILFQKAINICMECIGIG